MRNWQLLMMVMVAMGFMVAALGSEATADSHTKPKTEQAADAEKKMMPSKSDATPEETGMGTTTRKQGEAAGHEGHHGDHEGSQADEEKKEGSH